MSDLRIVPLTKPIATEYCDEVLGLLNLIPDVEYSRADVLAETKRGAPLTAKWQLSLIGFDDTGVAGVAIRYRRNAEPPLYPDDTIYHSGLAVRPDLQGQRVGSRLFDEALAWSDQWASENEPSLYCALQTNAAEFNARIREMYQRRGFQAVGTKTYINRTDVVMFRRP